MLKPICFLRSFLLPLGLAAAVQPLTAQDNITVAPNSTTRLTESGTYGSVTVGSGGTLQTVDANSGGAGDHAITVTFAASGPATFQNDGLIDLAGNDQGNTTVLANPVTLSGSGTLQLRNTYNGDNVASVQGPGTVTQNAGHTIVGASNGVYSSDTGPSFAVSLVNAGLVTTSQRGLHLDGPSVRNTGTLSASGGARLVLGTPRLDNTGGLVAVADADSSVNIAGGTTVIGGTLSSVNSTGYNTDAGEFFNDAVATLQDVTLAAGSVFSVDNPLTISGTLTNNGYIQVGGFNFNTGVYSDLNVTANATLAGSGTARLAGGQVNATNNATLTVPAGATLVGGPGTLNARIVNNGTVGSVYQDLDINCPVFTNNGTLLATSGGTVNISASTNLTNYNAASGTLSGGTYQSIDIGNGSNIDFGGRSILVNAATITLSGSGSAFGGAIRPLTTNAGTLSFLRQAEFTANGSVTNTGTINLDAGSTWHVGGNFTARGAASTLRFTIGGTATSGAQSPGVLQVAGSAKLGGRLEITLDKLAKTPTSGDTLTFLSAASMSGAFENAPNGKRVPTTDGRGSFLVTYGTSSISLRRFLKPGQTDPTPTVTIAAVGDDDAVKEGKDGEVIVKRTGDKGAPLTVFYKVEGPVRPGVDYKPLPGSVTLPAGAAHATVKIKTINDSAHEGTRLVKIKLKAATNGSYLLGATTTATVRIIDND